MAKVVVFGQKWLISGKNDCIPAKVVFFGQFGCIRARLFYSGKDVVFGRK